MMESFWIGGPAAYEQALQEHYKALLEDLRQRLESASDSEKIKVILEIDRMEAEYESKMDGINHSLF